MVLHAEPVLVTDPALEPVLKELISREPIFHRTEHGASRADFERMTAPDFWEIGASGLRYSRDFILDTLEERSLHPQPEDLQATGFHCRQLAPDVFLLTYTLLQSGQRLTRRSTIWQRSSEGWKILFHQGTVVQQEIIAKP
jgi:hypothetical protein